MQCSELKRGWLAVRLRSGRLRLQAIRAAASSQRTQWLLRRLRQSGNFVFIWNALVRTVRAKPDGYTITLVSASPLAVSPHTYKDLTYDPLTDLTAITTVAQTPELIAINPSVPAKSCRNL